MANIDNPNPRNPQNLQRGFPAPFSFKQRRPPGPRTTAFAGPVYYHSRDYSRGADAYAPQFGHVFYNPIGAGVVNQYPLPVISGMGATYVAKQIFFAPQLVPTSIPINPTVPMETIQAIISTADIRGSYNVG